MRQKIRFEKNIKSGVLTVMESSEVDPGVVMPLIEEEYDLAEITQASKQGLSAFNQCLRKRSFFPTSDLCETLYEQTRSFLKDKKEEMMIVEYDEAAALPAEETFNIEEENVELDKILEEDGDSKENEIKEIDSGDDTPNFKPEDISEHEN